VQRGVSAIAETKALDSIARSLQVQLTRLSGSPAGRRVKDALNGTWLGHPLHPALTDIPIGAWTTAAVFDVVTATGAADLDTAAEAALAVGIAGAVGAAATGLADWSDTRGAQRPIGLAHAGLNVAALLLESGSLVARRRGAPGAKLLSVLGLGTTLAAAYLGGDLVFRRGTQVDRNAWTRGGRSFAPVMAEADLAPEQPTRAQAGGSALVVIRHAGTIFALDDVCGHAGCPLSNGRLTDDAIECACHGSTYRLRDGAVLHGPAPFPQTTYDVRTRDGQIEVRRR
jgi:nitrite reductase/ring-hydroxylating ferredoxin subunit/uncharacterized membrane protein